MRRFESARAVPTIRTGTIGTPVASATRAAPRVQAPRSPCPAGRSPRSRPLAELFGTRDREQVSPVAPDRDPAERVHQPRARRIAPELDLGEEVQWPASDEREQRRVEQRLVVRRHHARPRRHAARRSRFDTAGGRARTPPADRPVEPYVHSRASSPPTRLRPPAGAWHGHRSPPRRRSAIGWNPPRRVLARASTPRAFARS